MVLGEFDPPSELFRFENSIFVAKLWTQIIAISSNWSKSVQFVNVKICYHIFIALDTNPLLHNILFIKQIKIVEYSLGLNSLTLNNPCI